MKGVLGFRVKCVGLMAFRGFRVLGFWVWGLMLRSSRDSVLRC